MRKIWCEYGRVPPRTAPQSAAGGRVPGTEESTRRLLIDGQPCANLPFSSTRLTSFQGLASYGQHGRRILTGARMVSGPSVNDDNGAWTDTHIASGGCEPRHVAIDAETESFVRELKWSAGVRLTN